MAFRFAILGFISTLAPGPASQPAALDRPRVELWINRDDPYRRGDGVRAYFRTDRDAYVTLLRVDTDGRVRVLFPREPWEDNFARGGREYEIEGRSSRDAFYVDDYPGVGYLFALAAADPFAYDAIQSGEHWDYRLIADGRVRGDPYVALTELARRIVAEGYTDWDYDIVPYYVERHYEYPRFLCYDCHAYRSWPSWDPYGYSCVRFRIVVFDDPFYYPYRYYGGTRVVFARPYRPEPRFIFKDWGGADRFVTRVRERPVNDDRRRVVPDRVDEGRGESPVPSRVEPPRVDDRRRRNQPERPGLVVPTDRADRRGPVERPEPRVGRSQPPSRTEPRAEPRVLPRSAPRSGRARGDDGDGRRGHVEPKRDAPREGERGERPQATGRGPELRRRSP